MALDVSAGQFILPRGTDAAENTVRVGQTLIQQKMLKDRRDQMLAQQQEAKRNTAGKFLESYLDPKQYLTGTQYDPAIAQKLQAAKMTGAQLASQGADIPSIMQALGPALQETSDYSSKAQLINKQADDMIKKMKENGYKGYDYATLKDQALTSAFHQTDPATGKDMGLKHASDIDTDTNWVMKTIQDNPGAVTNAGDFDAFAKESPMQKTLTDQTFYDKRGGMTKGKVHLIGQNWLTPEIDKNGAITDLVPKYDHANDGGEELQHTFTDGSGKETKAPIRLLDEGTFDSMMSQKKGAADYIRGQVMQHLKEYNDNSGQNIDLNSPKAKLVARAIAYDELNRRKSPSIENAAIYDKPSAAQVQLTLNGSKYDQAYDKTQARLDAESDAGVGPGSKVKPLNVAQTTNEIFNNNPDYIKGKPTNIDGHQAIDVTGSYQGAEFRFGHGEQEAYDKVYYDPQRRVLITQDKMGNKEEHKESDMPDFLQKVAGANKLNPSAIPKYLSAGGYSKGKYGKPGDASGAIQDLNKADEQEKTKALDELFTNGKGTALKGMKTPAGKIEEAGERGWYQSGKYYIKVKGADGQLNTKTFNSKTEMQQYLNSAPAPAAAPAPAKGTKTDKALDDLINKYSQ